MKRLCLECGTPFASADPDAQFCCRACRNRFNNRRMQRGQVIYDLFMPIRFERQDATAFGAWSLMCAAAAQWRDEDQRQRAGRRSWRPLKRQADTLMPFRGKVMSRNAAGARRS